MLNIIAHQENTNEKPQYDTTTYPPGWLKFMKTEKTHVGKDVKWKSLALLVGAKWCGHFGGPTATSHTAECLPTLQDNFSQIFNPNQPLLSTGPTQD